MHLQPRTLQSVFDLARLTFGQGKPPTQAQLELLRKALGERPRGGVRPESFGSGLAWFLPFTIL